MDLIIQGGPKRVTCFYKRRYNDEVNGISIKRPQFDANEDIIIPDYSKFKKIKRDIALKNLKIQLVEEALFVKRIYEKFHIKGVLHNIPDVIAY